MSRCKLSIPRTAQYNNHKKGKGRIRWIIPVSKKGQASHEPEFALEELKHKETFYDKIVQALKSITEEFRARRVELEEDWSIKKVKRDLSGGMELC